MPGVPSGRGCQACKRQKKKCDQAQPACTRCARLNIPCVGIGEQRYIFKTTGLQEAPLVKKFKPAANRRTTPPDVPRTIAHPLVSKLVAALEIRDARYGLQCYGDFLGLIPPRLGQSHHLDAAVKALLSVLPYHSTHRLPPDAIANYIDALTALRLCLNGPRRELAPETLSTIYIIMICQGWIGRSNDHVRSHGMILAQLTNSAIIQSRDDAFEQMFFRALLVPLVLEAMVNPAINLECWPGLIESTLRKTTCDGSLGIRVESLEAHKFIRMPVYFHTPLLYLSEVQTTYQDMRRDNPRLRQYLSDLEQEIASLPPDTLPPPTNDPRVKAFHKFQIVHALLLTVVIALNSILRRINPEMSTLLDEAIELTDDFLRLAENASKHRPLGAGFVPPCLTAVWATTTALPLHQARLEQLMAEYQSDALNLSWTEEAERLKALHTILLNSISGSPSGDIVFEEGQISGISMVHCKGAFGLGGSALMI